MSNKIVLGEGNNAKVIKFPKPYAKSRKRARRGGSAITPIRPPMTAGQKYYADQINSLLVEMFGQEKADRMTLVLVNRVNDHLSGRRPLR